MSSTEEFGLQRSQEGTVPSDSGALSESSEIQRAKPEGLTAEGLETTFRSPNNVDGKRDGSDRGPNHPGETRTKASYLFG